MANLILRGTILSAICLAIGGCNNSLYTLKEAELGQDFNGHLAKYYKAFSKREAKQYDWASSEYFARKGLSAVKQREVMPEDPKDWQIKPEADLKELQKARSTLLSRLENKDQYSPLHLSAAQVYFDCWVEQKSENWQPKDINHCKANFQKHLRLSSTNLSYVRKAPEQKSLGTIFFGFDSVKISDSYKAELNKTLNKLKPLPTQMTVIGHTDRSGSNRYNKILSIRRAQSVAKFIKQKYPNMEVKVVGNGSQDLLVPTPAETREPKNRRAEIKLKG